MNLEQLHSPAQSQSISRKAAKTPWCFPMKSLVEELREAVD